MAKLMSNYALMPSLTRSLNGSKKKLMIHCLCIHENGITVEKTMMSTIIGMQQICNIKHLRFEMIEICALNMAMIIDGRITFP